MKASHRGRPIRSLLGQSAGKTAPLWAIAKQNLDGLPLACLGEVRANTRFAGNNARLPFTERYRYLLYIVVTLAIAGLVLLQYRVFRHLEK